MLGGISNGAFFSGFGGFVVMALLLIPILMWIYPSDKKTRAAKKLRQKVKKDLKKVKRK